MDAELHRVRVEMAECARYLTDEAALLAWAERYHCTVDHARNGALAGAMDWLMEESILAGEAK